VLLSWAVSCASYELLDDGTANIYNAGFDTYRVESLPVPLELTILTRLLMLEDEEAEIEVHVLGPDTAPLGSLTHPITADPGPNHRPGYSVSQIEVLELAFLARTTGVYSVELYVDHNPDQPQAYEHRRSLFFNVREGLPTEA
jgi:hypothetical protein